LVDFCTTLAEYAPAFRRSLKVKRCRFHLAFSTGDAAETALLYGWLCPFLTPPRLPKLRGNKPEITLEPRFVSPRELALKGDISLTMPVILFLLRILPLAVRKPGGTSG
jgi:hypothetical protein